MVEFVARYPRAENSLDAWHRTAKEANWGNLAEVRKTYPHADLVGECTVFNIQGNAYRLIAKINYDFRTIHVQGVYTHKEYDQGGWKNGC